MDVPQTLKPQARLQIDALAQPIRLTAPYGKSENVCADIKDTIHERMGIQKRATEFTKLDVHISYQFCVFFFNLYHIKNTIQIELHYQQNLDSCHLRIARLHRCCGRLVRRRRCGGSCSSSRSWRNRGRCRS